MCNALTVTKRESAPLPERLCERIAYCAILLTVYEADYSVVVAQSEGADHRYYSTPEMQNILLQNVVGHAVRKAKNFAGGATDAILSGSQVLINLMSGFVLDKTKATAEGRQWVLRQIKPECIANNAAFVAGGQIFSGIFSLLPALGNGYLYRVFLHKTGLLFLMKSSSKKHSVDALGNSLVEGWGFIPHFRLRSSRKEVSISSFCASIIFLLDTALCHGSSHHGADSGYFCSSTSPCRDVFQVYSPIFVRLCVLRNCSRWKVLTFPCSVSCAISFAICWAKKSFNLGMIRPLLTVWRSSSLGSGANGDYSGYPLALRRWRYSTSRFNAAVTNCPVLSPGIFTASTLFITSCGTLAATVCDFAFTAFVAMLCTPYKKQMQYAGKKISVQHLTCLTPRLKLVFNTLLMQGAETTTPRSGGTHAGRLTTNDSKSIEVAMRNHTTHPQGRDSHNLNKYIWRFIALSTAQPRVIHIEATSEQEARQQSPDGCVMVFAARIRQEVEHV
ncbi:hypothetical protein BvCmsSINP022_00436 [Escherichia coli]|nr:hypothetical protein BvCmsSINP022_00436 [Escherichia coli]